MIRVGTCSWTEKTLIKSGEFYPQKVMSAEGRLRFYAESFDTVEIDSTYYAIPDARSAAAWAERTPKNFIFHIKVFGALTGHGVDPKTLPAEIIRELISKDRGKKYIYIENGKLLKILGEKFKESLSPLAKSGKLGLMVFQFPPWLHYKDDNLHYILSRVSLLGGLQTAVEFRHGSWLSRDNRGKEMDFLSRYGITYVTADEPQYGNLATIPFVPSATTDTVYFRFHGRNKENWLKKNIDTSLRYDYLYKETEIQEFVTHILEADGKGRIVFAMFNNCHRAAAIKNARRMKELAAARDKEG